MRALAFSSFIFTLLAASRIASLAQTPAGQSAGARSAPTIHAAQAALGQAAYRASCASCHGANLDDGAFGPPLKGVPFIQKYGGKQRRAALHRVGDARCRRRRRAR